MFHSVRISKITNMQVWTRRDFTPYGEMSSCTVLFSTKPSIKSVTATKYNHHSCLFLCIAHLPTVIWLLSLPDIIHYSCSGFSEAAGDGFPTSRADSQNVSVGSRPASLSESKGWWNAPLLFSHVLAHNYHSSFRRVFQHLMVQQRGRLKSQYESVTPPTSPLECATQCNNNTIWTLKYSLKHGRGWTKPII